MIDYSVIIRTTGKAHKKYQCLLNSIDKLEPQPKEIIIVLPEGNSLPKERLGNEIFYFCPKGMVIQRMIGISKCKTKYALICDDDVQFEADFVCKLYQPIQDKKCSISTGPLYSFLPPKGMNSIISTVMASACPTVFHKNRYVSVLRSSGYSYNRNLVLGEYYETQSVAWTCFFGEIEDIKRIELNEEKWLDLHGYSSLDDQTMFFKAWLRGIKTVVVSDAKYEHLDAKTSIRNNKEPVLFSLTFNRVVFWHRFIYKTQKNIVMKVWAVICFLYRSVWMLLFDLGELFRHRISKKDFEIKCSGYLEGVKYLRTDEYKGMSPVC